jgi:hypothetical protein
MQNNSAELAWRLRTRGHGDGFELLAILGGVGRLLVLGAWTLSFAQLIFRLLFNPGSSHSC